MQVTLNKNSWHYKYYNAMVSDTPPRTLCPYFWIMVALIIISPFVGVFFLVDKTFKFFVKLIPKRAEKEETYEEMVVRWEKRDEVRRKKTKFWGNVADYISKFFKWIVLPAFGLIVLWALSVTSYELGWLQSLIRVGIFLVIVAIIVGFIYFLEEYGEYIAIGLGGFGRFIGKIFKFINPLNWKVTQIIGEMIKAGYTKACPLIQWDGNLEESKNNIQIN